ncbi:GIY-YIG nuclease family protein [Pararhizobium sp. BT-229]|uniref:GIY-YIG nuclease family protein n=1 Tax=Pararhizobium sp. BT-229 TaxID=2986923 RepID=UPI0021F6F5DF|nr:GIY-YIG nuclease family protein [Pararhizobium sp. BT-229]MCV9960399.1 GIY-YIG nuclease family protein [Pararhizobium sp. BT-229]
MLIHNYGLFWRRSIIAADGPWPRSGDLLGIGVKQKRRGKVDFSRQRGIYALYDDNFRLIYVGQAGRGDRRLYNRLRSHSINNLAERWSRFSWFGILPVHEDPASKALKLVDDHEPTAPTRETVLNHMEAILIMAGEPIRNAKGGVFGKEVTLYRQTTAGAGLGEDDTDATDD